MPMLRSMYFVRKAYERGELADDAVSNQTLPKLIGRSGKSWAKFVAEHMHDFMY